MSLQLECKYLHRTVPEVGALMEPIERALREAFFPALFGEGEVDNRMQYLLDHSVKCSGLGIPYPRELMGLGHTTS